MLALTRTVENGACHSEHAARCPIAKVGAMATVVAVVPVVAVGTIIVASIGRCVASTMEARACRRSYCQKNHCGKTE